MSVELTRRIKLVDVHVDKDETFYQTDAQFAKHRRKLLPLAEDKRKEEKNKPQVSKVSYFYLCDNNYMTGDML